MIADRLLKFEDKWRDDSSDYPICASCGTQIGSEESEEQDEETYEPEIPLRLWRDHPTIPKEKQELCFHHACAAKEGII
jgi:hypothetical protein